MLNGSCSEQADVFIVAHLGSVTASYVCYLYINDTAKYVTSRIVDSKICR